ncbi:GNAT family N-acetyltransferase [Marinomonas gallaica]|uniref:GNAT family N-acetyltransferase n=1 Tax=Marinomonas gallaica TaxID=1806667 RepID=UPI00082A6A6F|nr:GNAT family N-acetyltransferase [Marinomonas gallaica]
MTSIHSPHRHCVISQQTRGNALNNFAALTQRLADTLVVSHCEEVLLAGTTQTTFNGLKRQLGNNYSAIFLDLSAGLNLSALAIVAGTLKGGGLLVLYLGPHWCSNEDQELARFLPWPLESTQVSSTYKTLFWQALSQPNSPFTEQWPQTLSPYQLTEKNLTSDQHQFISQVLERPPSTHILIAARGRGKSYALAELLYQAKTRDQQCFCTASSLHNLATLVQHFQELSETQAPFIAPDELLRLHTPIDLLVVDEAASIPLPMLEQMAQKAKRVIFSSTDFGYEGSGRGFGLRFRQHLRHLKTPCHEYTLSTPLRWGESDPLEIWLDQLLFKEYQRNVELEDTPNTLCGAQWLQYPNLLDQAFALLVSAHYQTTPENKRWLVDDPSVITFFHYHDKKLLGVALVTAEGRLPKDLSEQVAQGKRRPRGHLVPQSLLAHEGIQDAGQYTYWRISRIAIAPEAQRQGLGSQLIESIYQAAHSQAIDFLCTSFAATTEVVSFWQQNNFRAVRLGSAKDQASGAYSLMMLRPLSKIAHSRHHFWCQQFSQLWLSSLPLGLQQLSPALISTIAASCIMGENPHIPSLTDKTVSDLIFFANYSRPYDSVRSQLLHFTLNLLEQKKLHPNNPQHLLLLGCALNIFTEKDAHDLDFSGKKDLFKALKATVNALLPA